MRRKEPEARAPADPGGTCVRGAPDRTVGAGLTVSPARVLVVAVGVLATVGCGGSGTTTQKEVAGEVEGELPGGDTVIRPDDVKGDADGRAPTDIEVDYGFLGDHEGETPVWKPIPCESHTDCPEGYCVELESGSGETFCTLTCVEECPLDWVCKSVFVDGPDPVSLCMPPSNTLCKVCKTDEDCLLADSLCIKGKGALGYCGRVCDPEKPGCPLGFDCGLVEDGEGQPQGYQCIPAPGSCCVAGGAKDCNDDNPCTFDGCDPSLGCTHEPQDGECDGDDPCLEWLCADGKCTGIPIETDDTANKIDDDCDGLTDEDAYKGFRLEAGSFSGCGGTSESGTIVLSGELSAPAFEGVSEGPEFSVSTGLAGLLSWLGLQQ
ncbi:MAG: hypothetical protein FJ109_09215 [Deltaproteobacteria bacterium]|nr:hypothetical protein [Deltaproteobacteria bacterium]